jgi:hypothetical protein
VAAAGMGTRLVLVRHLDTVVLRHMDRVMVLRRMDKDTEILDFLVRNHKSLKSSK